MRMTRRLSTSLAALILLASNCLADAGTMSLGDMIKYSDLIVVGRVLSARVGGKAVAELEVTETLKGDASLRRVRFVSGMTWVCDVSTAVDGEAGLFFLSRHPTNFPPEKAPPQDYSDGLPLFYITHSGRGRMIFRHVGGETFVPAHRRGDVRFPGGLRFAHRPDAEDRDFGLVRLSDVLSYIRKRV